MSPKLKSSLLALLAFLVPFGVMLVSWKIMQPHFHWYHSLQHTKIFNAYKFHMDIVWLISYICGAIYCGILAFKYSPALKNIAILSVVWVFGDAILGDVFFITHVFSLGFIAAVIMFFVSIYLFYQSSKHFNYAHFLIIPYIAIISLQVCESYVVFRFN